MEKLFLWINISVALGVIIGVIITVTILLFMISLGNGNKKVTPFSCIVTAFLAAFLSIQISLAVGEWRLNKAIEEPLEYAETANEFLCGALDAYNSISHFTNLIPGLNLPNLTDIDINVVSQIRENINSHRIRHILYVIIGLIISTICLYMSFDKERNVSPGRHRNRHHSNRL